MTAAIPAATIPAAEDETTRGMPAEAPADVRPRRATLVDPYSLPAEDAA